MSHASVHALPRCGRSSRRLRFAALFLLLSGIALHGRNVFAQPAPGQHRGLFITMTNGPAGTSRVLQLGPQNTGTLFSTTPTGPWPVWGNVFGAARHPNNQDLVMPAIAPATNATYVLVNWDPTAPGVSATLWTSPAPPAPAPLANYGDCAADPDGEYVTIDNASTPQGMMFFDPVAATWRREALPATIAPVAGTSGLVWDRLSGGFVVSAWGGTLGSITLPSSTYRVDYRGRNTTLLNAHTGNAPVAVYGGDLVQTGDWVSSSRSRNSIVFRATPGQSGWQSGPNLGVPGWAVEAEHYAKPGVGVWVATGAPPYGVLHLDLTPATPVATTIFTGSAATMPAGPCSIASLYTNDLVTVRTGARTWNLLVNPAQPALANRPYIVGASLAGTAMIRLPDGREAFITPDDAFGLSTSGRLAPFITNTLGTLDGNGQATCGIDLNVLGTAANGLVIHFAAVVLDPSAPSGIAHVTQPWAFVVDNR